MSGSSLPRLFTVLVALGFASTTSNCSLSVWSRKVYPFVLGKTALSGELMQGRKTSVKVWGCEGFFGGEVSDKVGPLTKRAGLVIPE